MEKMMRRIIALMVLVLLPALSGQANAELMTIWDFGPTAGTYTLDPQYEYVTGTPAMSAGNADYDINGGNGIAFSSDAAGNSHIAGQSLHWEDVSGTGANDAYIIITIDTTGWQDMAIRWDYKSDATGNDQGPTSFDLNYKVGSGSWINILYDQSIIRDDIWHEFSYDLSSETAIENQPFVQFRIDDFDNNDQEGDYWQDNVQLTGVPEPATLSLLAVGGLVLLRKRRRKQPQFPDCPHK